MVAVRAVYLDGQLRLLSPVDLKAGQIVTLKIEAEELTEGAELPELSPEEELALLKAALGDRVRWADPNYDDGNAWVEEEAENIAGELAGGKPLSEIIIEERHEP